METVLAARRSPPRAQVACAVCAFNPLCNSRSPVAGAPSPVESRRRLAAGETLYRAGSAHSAIYAVRAGFLKSCAPCAGGSPCVTRVLMPGDVAGLDGYASGFHECDAVALGDCELCEIPAYRGEILSDFNPRVGAHLRRLLARELGYSANAFMLPMSRRDIASHLALTPESLSRVLAHFQERGWIRLDKRYLEIVDADALSGAVAAS